MKIVGVATPVYAKPDKSSIDCMVTFENGKTYPYTAVSNDSTPYGRQLWADLLAGKYGAISPCAKTE